MKRAVTLIVLAGFVTGCGIFSRSKSRIYTLDRIDAQSVSPFSGTPVGIDVLELPPGLERREVVVKKSGDEIEVRGTEQWSASLRELVLHTLAFDLAARLPVGAVVAPGAAKPAAMRGIDVVFEELGAGPENRVSVDVRWTLRTGAQSVAHREQFAVDIPSTSSEDVARGVSQALAVLADRMAAALAR
jgi:uncharacterized lipoprotein YmbA